MRNVLLMYFLPWISEEDLMEFLYRESLVYKIWRCRYSNTLYFRKQIPDASYFFLFIDEAHLRGEEVEIEIEDTISTWSIVHICIEFIIIFYAYDFSYQAICYRRSYIVSDIALVVRESPYG